MSADPVDDYPEVPITLYQWATWSQEFQVLDGLGQPLDFSGASARLQIRERTDSSVILADIGTLAGGITLGASGVIACTIDATVTAALPVPAAVDSWRAPRGELRYDLFVTFPDYRLLVCHGPAMVIGRVTRISGG